MGVCIVLCARSTQSMQAPHLEALDCHQLCTEVLFAPDDLEELRVKDHLSICCERRLG
jgi:hypothetical protein